MSSFLFLTKLKLRMASHKKYQFSIFLAMILLSLAIVGIFSGLSDENKTGSNILSSTSSSKFNLQDNLNDTENALNNQGDGDKFSEPYDIANSTLGFGKIYYINIPGRYTHNDLMALQGSVSGLTIDRFLGTVVDDIYAKTPEDTVADTGENEKKPPTQARPANGLPPFYQTAKNSESACTRSHASLWKKFLQSGLETVMIFESDAMWDIHIRKMMYYFSTAIRQAIVLRTDMPEEYTNPTEEELRNDPYLYENWDILNFGGCFADKMRHNHSLQYYDPYAPDDAEYFGIPVNARRRVLRWNGQESCLTAYALTRRGAAKLLTAYNLDGGKPVDTLVREMIYERTLDSYSVYPILFAQWYYDGGAGAESKNSDIQMANGEGQNDVAEEKTDSVFWAKAKKMLNTWIYGGHQQDVNFRDCTLFTLKKQIIGSEEGDLVSMNPNAKVQQSGDESAAEEDDQRMIYWKNEDEWDV